MGKGDEAGGDFHRRGSKEKQEIKKTFQKRENKNEGGETPLLTVLGSGILSRSRRGEQGARRPGDSVILIYWRIQE